MVNSGGGLFYEIVSPFLAYIILYLYLCRELKTNKMSTTVKKLVGILTGKGINQDALITDEQLRDFIHITHDTQGNVRLCTNRPIGRCNRTGEYVYPSLVKGYIAYCPELDEDLYEFEFTRIDHKAGER